MRDHVKLHLHPIERTLWPGVRIPIHTDSPHMCMFTSTGKSRALTSADFNNFGALIKFLGGPAGQGQQLKDNMTRSGKFNQKHADWWSDYMKSVRYGGTGASQKQLDKRHGGAGVTQKQLDTQFGGAGMTQKMLHAYARGKQTRPCRYRPEP